jgi:6-phosphogluconolactonase/glucosamine-6-phosphate isomerase/deaminase
MNVHRYIYEDPPETAAACCRKILDLLKETLANQDRPTLAVSGGGSTPKLLFAEMAKPGFDWTRTHLFWVDERGVPRNVCRGDS